MRAIALDTTPPSQLDMEILRRTYDTNVFGVFAVTKAMLPLLRKAEAGRIVNMSSGLGSLTQTSDPNWAYARVNLLAYNSSKTAVNAITVQFANELRDTPIKVNAADPGLRGDGLEPASGASHGSAGRNGSGATGDTSCGRPHRRLLRRRRRCALVIYLGTGAEPINSSA